MVVTITRSLPFLRERVDADSAAKIGEHYPAFLVEKDVAGLDVAVDHTLLVGVACKAKQ